MHFALHVLQQCTIVVLLQAPGSSIAFLWPRHCLITCRLYTEIPATTWGPASAASLQSARTSSKSGAVTNNQSPPQHCRRCACAATHASWHANTSSNGNCSRLRLPEPPRATTTHPSAPAAYASAAAPRAAVAPHRLCTAPVNWPAIVYCMRRHLELMACAAAGGLHTTWSRSALAARPAGGCWARAHVASCRRCSRAAAVYWSSGRLPQAPRTPSAAAAPPAACTAPGIKRMATAVHRHYSAPVNGPAVMQCVRGRAAHRGRWRHAIGSHVCRAAGAGRLPQAAAAPATAAPARPPDGIAVCRQAAAAAAAPAAKVGWRAMVAVARGDVP